MCVRCPLVKTACNFHSWQAALAKLFQWPTTALLPSALHIAPSEVCRFCLTCDSEDQEKRKEDAATAAKDQKSHPMLPSPRDGPKEDEDDETRSRYAHTLQKKRSTAEESFIRREVGLV